MLNGISHGWFSIHGIVATRDEKWSGSTSTAFRSSSRRTIQWPPLRGVKNTSGKPAIASL